MTSLNKNVDSIPYKKKGLAEFNENLGFSTLIVQLFLTFEAEQRPCSPIFIHARCTCQKVNYSRSRTAQACVVQKLNFLMADYQGNLSPLQQIKL